MFDTTLKYYQSAQTLSDTDLNDRLYSSEIKRALEIFQDQIQSYISLIQRRIDINYERLNPQLKERDVVKSQMGHSWYTNPHPKNDFADKRRVLTEELDLLESLVNSLAELSFTASNVHC